MSLRGEEGEKKPSALSENKVTQTINAITSKIDIKRSIIVMTVVVFIILLFASIIPFFSEVNYIEAYQVLHSLCMAMRALSTTGPVTDGRVARRARRRRSIVEACQHAPVQIDVRYQGKAVSALATGAQPATGFQASACVTSTGKDDVSRQHNRFSERPMKNIVILTAGTGGAVAASMPAHRLDLDEWAITIIDRTSKHVYQPSRGCCFCRSASTAMTTRTMSSRASATRFPATSDWSARRSGSSITRASGARPATATTRTTGSSRRWAAVWRPRKSRAWTGP